MSETKDLCAPHQMSGDMCIGCGKTSEEISNPMLVSVAKARKKAQAEKDFNFCIEHLVCPECAEDLEIIKVNIPPIDAPMYSTRELKCSVCELTYEQIIKY